jgi:hypothetical protein
MDYENNWSKLTKETSTIFIEILDKYIKKVNDMKDFLELKDIGINMIMELSEKCPLSAISFDECLVREIVGNLIKFDEQYKNYPINEDRMTWITREFHDSYYDYDGIENDVKKAMQYVKENYEN